MAEGPAAPRPSFTVRDFAATLRPYAPRIAAACALMAATIALQAAAPLLARAVVDGAASGAGAAALLRLCAGLAVLTAARVALSSAEDLVLMVARSDYLSSLRLRLYDHVQRLPLDFLRSTHTGQIVSRVGFDVQALPGIMADTAVAAARNVLTFAVGGAIAYSISPPLFFVALAFIPPYAFLLFRFRGRIRSGAAEVADRFAALQSSLQECLAGIFVIQSSWGLDASLRRLRASAEDVRRIDVSLGKLDVLLSLLSSAIAEGVPLAILAYGAVRVSEGAMTIGDIVAFNSYVRFLYGPTQGLVSIVLGVQRSLAAADRVFALLREPAVDESGAEAPGRDPAERAPAVRFDKVSFSRGGRAILRDVSFEIAEGERVLLVGPSGAGKTTILNLLLRFHEPEGGEVSFRGRNAADIALPSLRGAIASMPQDDFLFSASIRENALFPGDGSGGRPSPEDLAREGGPLAFAARLEGGLDAQVGERGARLSGGERQRVALARALLRDAPVVLIDEGLSQVDPATEEELAAAIDAACGGRTVVRVTHRVSRCAAAPRVIVLDGGRVVGDGNHAELLRTCPEYRELYLADETTGGGR